MRLERAKSGEQLISPSPKIVATRRQDKKKHKEKHFSVRVLGTIAYA